MNPLRRLFPSIALAGLLALSGRASAQTQTFVQKTKIIRAGIVLLDGDHLSGNVYGQTATPYAFYNLDNAQGVKPGDWSFINPSAPGTVSQDTKNRYAELGYTNNDLPAVNSPISKRNGDYWTVSLSKLSESQLANYDVLLISPRFYFALSTVERERLRRFVDGGGVLWVDLGNLATGAASRDVNNNLPLAVDLGIGNADNFRANNGPLIDGVRRVTDTDLAIINAGNTRALLPVFDSGAFQNLLFGLTAEFARYSPITTTTTSAGQAPTIAEAHLGDGTIVVTSRNAASYLNGDPTNLGYRGLAGSLNSQGRAAARLAINIVASGPNYRQPVGGSRKTNSATADPGAPVLTRFTAENLTAYGPGGVIGQGSPLDPNNVPIGAPVTYKGFLIASVYDAANGNYRVVVMDAKPDRDLDGDGDPDDGIYDPSINDVNNNWRDTSVGKSVDVVWVSQPLSNRISSPVVAVVPEAGGTAVEQILVTDGLGNLIAFHLNEQTPGSYRLNGGQHAPFYTVSPVDEFGGNALPADDDTRFAVKPPTVIDNLAYIADSVNSSGTIVGRVWVADLTTGREMFSNASSKAWYVGGRNVTSGTPMLGFTAGATIGNIPIGDNSGGVDRVLYAPGLFTGSNYLQPGFESLWIGTKGEAVPEANFEATAGGNLDITTRAGTGGQLPIYFPGSNTGNFSPAMRQMAPHLTLLAPNGQALSPAQMSTYVNLGVPAQIGGANGVIRFGANVDKQKFIDDNIGIRIDYTLDWGYDPVNLSGAMERGRLLLPIRKSPNVDPNQKILGSIALTTRGTLHMIESDYDPKVPGSGTGGSYFAIREDNGRGSFRVVNKYTLYSDYNQTFAAGGVSVGVPAVLDDVDDVQNFIPDPFQSAPTFHKFTNFTFGGGVAVRNGIAYTTINATRMGAIPVTILAAFKAEPETPEIHLGTDLPANPRIIQTDFQRSLPTSIVQSPTQSTLAGDRLTVDTNSGVIRIENLATVNRNEITDCLSLSQPIGIGGDGRAYQFRIPDREGDRWSPLLWYALWNGGTSSGTPLVAGNEVFLSVNTILPGLLNNGTIGTSSGVIWAVDADTPTTGSYVKTVTTDPAQPLKYRWLTQERPWLVQAVQLHQVSGNNIDVSPYFRMPQNRGLTSFPDWQLRLNQTVLGKSTLAYGAGGGDGTVVAWGNRGLYGLTRADFVVADEGRLMRVDSSGNPVSNAFGGRFSGEGNTGAVGEYRPLVRPVKAYPVGDDDYLVVDAGANRVIRLDGDGTELRSIDHIALDPKYKPDAYRPNEPLKLKDPRDVATFEGYVTKGATEVVTDQQPTEYWIHYLIADAGNGRLVELVDRFAVDSQGRIGAPIMVLTPDPVTGDERQTAQVGVLVWKSPALTASSKGGDYYNSVSRVFVGTFGTGRYVYVAGVSKTRPTRISAGLDNPNTTGIAPSGSGGGAVVVFDPLGGTRVFDQFSSPDLTTIKFLNPKTDVFETGLTANRPAATRPFAGLVAVSTGTTLIDTTDVGLRITVTDADAVYEFRIRSTELADPNGSGVLSNMSWMINEAAFTALRPSAGGNAKYFRPVYARRLDSGDFIVVNGYGGMFRNNTPGYPGEVVLLSGGVDPNVNSGDFGVTKNNLGFLFSSIRFELPPLTGIRSLVSPVFADRR